MDQRNYDKEFNMRYLKEEQWLFDPKNKTIVEELKAALKEKANRKIDLSSFKSENTRTWRI